MTGHSPESSKLLPKKKAAQPGTLQYERDRADRLQDNLDGATQARKLHQNRMHQHFRLIEAFLLASAQEIVAAGDKDQAKQWRHILLKMASELEHSTL